VSRQPSRAALSGREREQKPISKFRATPRLYHYDGPVVSPATMHWSKGSTHGNMPARGFRAHTVTLVEQTAWIFGGQDETKCWDDVWCLDLGGSFLQLV
jgi:hypothetical protein